MRNDLGGMFASVFRYIGSAVVVGGLTVSYFHNKQGEEHKHKFLKQTNGENMIYHLNNELDLFNSKYHINIINNNVYNSLDLDKRIALIFNEIMDKNNDFDSKKYKNLSRKQYDDFINNIKTQTPTKIENNNNKNISLKLVVNDSFLRKSIKTITSSCLFFPYINILFWLENKKIQNVISDIEKNLNNGVNILETSVHYSNEQLLNNHSQTILVDGMMNRMKNFGQEIINIEHGWLSRDLTKLGLFALSFCGITRQCIKKQNLYKLIENIKACSSFRALYNTGLLKFCFFLMCNFIILPGFTLWSDGVKILYDFISTAYFNSGNLLNDIKWVMSNGYPGPEQQELLQYIAVDNINNIKLTTTKSIVVTTMFNLLLWPIFITTIREINMTNLLLLLGSIIMCIISLQLLFDVQIYGLLLYLANEYNSIFSQNNDMASSLWNVGKFAIKYFGYAAMNNVVNVGMMSLARNMFNQN